MKFDWKLHGPKLWSQLPRAIQTVGTIRIILTAVAKKDPKVAIPHITLKAFVKAYGDTKVKDIPNKIISDIKSGVDFITKFPSRVAMSVKEIPKTVRDGMRLAGDSIRERATKLIADPGLSSSISDYHSQQREEIKEDLKARWKDIWNDPTWYSNDTAETLLRHRVFGQAPTNHISHSIAVDFLSRRTNMLDDFSSLKETLDVLIENYFISLGMTAPEGMDGDIVLTYLMISAKLYGLILWLYKSQNCNKVKHNGRLFRTLLSGSAFAAYHSAWWIDLGGEITVPGGNTPLSSADDTHYTQFQSISNVAWAAMIQDVRPNLFLPANLAAFCEYLFEGSFELFSDERSNELVNFVPHETPQLNWDVIEEISDLNGELTEMIQDYPHLTEILSMLGYSSPMIGRDFTRDLSQSTFTIKRDPLLLPALLNTEKLLKERHSNLSTVDYMGWVEDRLYVKFTDNLFNQEKSRNIPLAILGEFKKFDLLHESGRIINCIAWYSKDNEFKVFNVPAAYSFKLNGVGSEISNSILEKWLNPREQLSPTNAESILHEYFLIHTIFPKNGVSSGSIVEGKKVTRDFHKNWEGDVYAIPDWPEVKKTLRSYLFTGYTDYDLSQIQNLVGTVRLTSHKV